MKARCIRIDHQGDPDVMTLVEIDLEPPAQGEALVRQSACGVNFLDVYQRSGAYPMEMPIGIGNEAAGIIEAIGPGVDHVKVGDRVSYQGGSPGAYADLRIVPAWRLIAVPDSLADEDAAAITLRGMTVEYLLERCVRLNRGDFALMYAAAGGIGMLAGQWAAHLGIQLIGVAAGAEKCAAARQAGYFAVIDRTSEDIVAQVHEITGGAGVPVVFDSIGKATFDTTIECLAPRGVFVSFGATSGPPPPVEAALLQKKGSLYFTRPTLATYCSSPEDYAASARRVMKLAGDGAVTARIGQRYPLEQAAQAHRDLEAGKTRGSTVLLP